MPHTQHADPVIGPTSETSLRHTLALLHTPGIGPAHLQKLLTQFPEPEAVFSLSPAELAHTGLSAAIQEQLRTPDWAAVDRDLEWSERPDNHLISLHDDRYPPLLREISHPPCILFVHGQPETLQRMQLAIVGSRNPTRAGLQNAHAFSRHLATSGLAISSGLALGIDAAAHQGALEADAVTLAVMGTGLDRVYPARHRELAHRIAARGALISELAPGTPPLAQNFPRRNRIISGLSLGVLVVEAAQRSGSLITAHSALEQGREVFAIPGSIHNPLAHGCHALIRNGAKLVENAEHVMEELGALALSTLTTQPPASDSRPAGPGLDAEYTDLLETMGYDPVSIDELVGTSGLTPEQLSSMLLLLELEGLVISSHGGRYMRTQNENPA